MRKQLCVITFVLLLFSMLALSVSAAIVLMTPGDGAVITTTTTDFIFGFDMEPNVLNCSLVIDGAVQKTMNSLIKLNNNKFTLAVADGSHTWNIQCYDTEMSSLVSESRNFKVDAGQSIKEGYTIVYYSTGLRSYVFTIALGQEEVTLPAMKGGEDINIKLGGKSYYLDVLKMGAYLDTYFVDVRDRNSGKISHMLVGDSVKFDFNDDEVIEVELQLKDVERNINAYFVVKPYPGTTAPVTPTTPETPPVVTPPEEEPVEQGTGTTTPAEQPAGQETGEEKPSTQPQPEQEAEPKEASILTIILPALLVLIIIIMIILVVMNKRKGSEKQSPKKKEAKTPKKEAKKELPPETLNEEEEAAPLDEKFDIIKSTGGRVRR